MRKIVPVADFDPQLRKAVFQGRAIFTNGEQDKEHLEWEARRLMRAVADDPFPKAVFHFNNEVRTDVLNRWARPPVEIVSNKDQRIGTTRIFRNGVPIEDWVEAIAKGRADEPVLVICHPENLEAVVEDLESKGYDITNIEGDMPR